MTRFANPQLFAWQRFYVIVGSSGAALVGIQFVVMTLISNTLALTAAFLRANTRLALFFVGSAALGLLLIGIHNSWDTVTHIVVSESHDDATKTE